MWVVYEHKSPSGKVYIGITGRNPLKRWSNGKGYLGKSNGKYIQPLFANAIIKYGWDNIEHKILFTNLSKQEACTKEINLIKYYKSIGMSYNITNGGEGNLGYVASIEAKIKISKALKGRPSKLRGVKRSHNTKLKISIASKKRGVSKEHMNKLHENNRGKSHSKSWCENIGKNNPKCKAVVQLDKEGNVIKEYYSVGEASKKNNIPYTTLVQYIRSNRLGRGFYWKVEETSNKDLLKL